MDANPGAEAPCLRALFLELRGRWVRANRIWDSAERPGRSDYEKEMVEVSPRPPKAESRAHVQVVLPRTSSSMISAIRGELEKTGRNRWMWALPIPRPAPWGDL